MQQQNRILYLQDYTELPRASHFTLRRIDWTSLLLRTANLLLELVIGSCLLCSIAIYSATL